MVYAEGAIEEGVLLVAESDASPRASSWADQRHGRLRGRRCTAAILKTSIVLALVCLVVWPRHSVQRAQADSRVALFSPLAIGSAMVDGVTGISGWRMAVTEPLEQVRKEVLASKPMDLTNLTNLTFEQRVPHERMHDGNVCTDEEEEFGGLCYEKCLVLTEGQFPLRTTAWSCCKAQPCTFMNSKFTSPLHLCGGFDVSGRKETRACPHAPGSCLVNEEFHLGRCYKKCAILTNNSHPFRSAASTCCRYNSHLACIDAVNVLSSPTFDVGGGGGDGHASTPAESHVPLPALTEA